MRTSHISLNAKRKRRPKSSSPSFTKEEFATVKKWPIQILNICDILKRKGFTLYRNEQFGTLAVLSDGFIFEFKRFSRPHVQKFVDWFQDYRSVEDGLSALPKGIKVFPVRKSKKSILVEGAKIPSARASILIESGNGTMPGHYAELDWNDLRVRR